MPQMFPNNKVEAAVESFKCNFGKSRYWHVENMQNYLNKPCMNFKDKFLSDYVNALKKSYSRASLCDGIEVFSKIINFKNILFLVLIKMNSEKYSNQKI